MTKTGVNNLSQQLCELCGIKPRYFIEFTRTSGCGAIAKSLSAFSYRTIRSAKNYIIEHKNETESELRIVQRYPDFENPENFVKLFNLITHIEDFHFATGQTYISCIPIYRFSSYLTTESNQYESYSNDVVKAFLECLIEHVKEDKDTAEYIASEEWEY